MTYTARWGKKGFLTSPTKVVPFQDFKTGVALKTDSENDTSGTNPTNTRGLEAQTITFSTTYMRAAGVDPRAQYEEWCGEIGKSYPLYIGNKRFGPAKMMLTKVDIADQLLTPSGEFAMISLSLTLAEPSKFDKKKTSTKSKSSSGTEIDKASANKAASVYAATVAEKKAALNTTASKTDKQQKKTSSGGGSR